MEMIKIGIVLGLMFMVAYQMLVIKDLKNQVHNLNNYINILKRK